MRNIPLTQGKVAIVDDCDFARLMQWKWCAAKKTRSGGRLYWCATRTDTSGGPGNYERVYMHREIAAVAGIPQVDHQDGDGLNNRRSNLRPATGHQNQGNKRKQVGCTSQYKGVSWSKQRGMWKADIKQGGKKVYLGYFADEVLAAKAYDAAAVEYFGEFALLNFVGDNDQTAHLGPSEAPGVILKPSTPVVAPNHQKVDQYAS